MKLRTVIIAQIIGLMLISCSSASIEVQSDNDPSHLIYTQCTIVQLTRGLDLKGVSFQLDIDQDSIIHG
ncbi:MAG: hypothetical protein H6598_03975 [Flavobacteriales bacterium]|nr:hypothetical protein [Flavobacteriales bacterium]